MANQNDTGNQDDLYKDTERPEETGRKAIEADKKINKQDKSPQQIEEEEKKDARQWRNEG